MDLIRNKKNVRIYLIVTSIVFGILILPSLPLIMMSAMMFDSPGSEDSSTTITLVFSIISYPIITLVAIAGGWILFATRKYLWSIICTSIPLLNIVIGVITIAILFIFCEGSFDCHF